MSIHYRVAIDNDDDGAFSAQEDISADVLELRWRLGMAQPYEHSSAPGWAQITLRNEARQHSPEHSALLPGQRIIIESDDGSTVRRHFTGHIARVEPTTGEHGAQQSVLYAQGREAEIAQHRARLPVLVNARADEALALILDALPLRYAALSGFLILDRAGHNSIDQDWVFPAQALSRQFDTGISVFAYLGEDWADGLPADEAIRQLAESESGRFFVNRSGEAVFTNRHHVLHNRAVAASFQDDMAGLSYAHGAGVVNQVDVRIRPRAVGAEKTLLWSLGGVLKLPPDSTHTLTAAYQIDKQPVGALSVVELRPAVHYAATSKADGGGDDRTADVRAAITEASRSAAQIELHNGSQDALYLQRLDVRGTPVMIGEPLTLRHSDALSRSLYGLRGTLYDLSAISDLDEAAALAQYELARRRAARGIVRRLQTNAYVHPQETLALTLLDRIQVEETQSAHNAAYIIVAEEHHVRQGGAQHSVEWLLEPDESAIFFLVDQHSLDGEQVLIPR